MHPPGGEDASHVGPVFRTRHVANIAAFMIQSSEVRNPPTHTQPHRVAPLRLGKCNNESHRATPSRTAGSRRESQRATSNRTESHRATPRCTAAHLRVTPRVALSSTTKHREPHRVALSRQTSCPKSHRDAPPPCRSKSRRKASPVEPSHTEPQRAALPSIANCFERRCQAWRVAASRTELHRQDSRVAPLPKALAREAAGGVRAGVDIGKRLGGHK